jgi:hypothetical protein
VVAWHLDGTSGGMALGGQAKVPEMHVSRIACLAVVALTPSLAAGCSGQAGSALPAAAHSVVDGAPSQRAANGSLLYVSDSGTDDVQFFGWPKPSKPLGALTGFNEPQGLCNDGKNVYVTNTGDKNVLVYAAGSSAPSRTIEDPGGYPVWCSFDPTSGALAVSNVIGSSYGPGSIAIYNQAKGKPRYIASSELTHPGSVQYDASGNLFITGSGSPRGSVLAELAATSKHIKIVCSSSTSGFFGGELAWDGKRLVVGAQGGDGVYRLNGCKRAGFTPLSGASDIVQFYIDGNRLVGADAGNADVEIYPYPKGGSPTTTLNGAGFSEPIGITIVAGSKN